MMPILKSRIKKLSVEITVFVAAVVICGSFLIQKYLYSSQFAQPVGALKTTSNETLRMNISTFMESQGSIYDIGHDNYHCSDILYAYDNAYAYALVYCSGFVVNDKNEVVPGTGLMTPLRLAYTRPNFKVTSYKTPGDGDKCASAIKKLFLEKFYESVISNPSKTEVNHLQQEVRSRVKVN